MAYETSAFGNGVVGTGNSNVTLRVSNQYGPRLSGGGKGVVRTAGGENEAVVNFTATGPLYDQYVIPAGSLVTDVRGYNLTGTIATATVGALSVALADDGDDTTWVPIVTAGDLAVTGPTAGYVVVKYRHYAPE